MINSEEYNISPISDLSSTLFYIRSFPILIYRDLKRRIIKYNRRQDISYSSFDSRFKKIFETKYWEKSNDLQDCCFAKSLLGIDFTKHEKKIINGKLCNISRHDYFKYDCATILELIKKNVGNETVVDFGCGYGIVLFGLKYLNFKNTLEGYEMTKYGLQTARAINDYFKLDIKFGKIDLTKNFDMIELKGKTIFTHYVMEELKYDMQRSIQNIINSKPKQVLHFEPMFELYEINLRDLARRTYLKCVDYQRNLLSTLRIFEKEGKLKILDVYRMGIGGQPFDELFFIRWVPI